MAITVYSNIIKGFIEYTGNTITLYNNIQVQATGAPPAGTSIAQTAWRTNSSSALLTGNPGATVVAAYLCWMSTPVPDANGSSTNQNIAVSFTTPLGLNSIAPNSAWSQQTSVPGQQFNIRVADVTKIVSAAGTGVYTVGGVPTGQNYSGWTLAVVWADTTQPPRFINVITLDVLNGSTLQIPVSGFETAGTGTVPGRAAMVVGSAESNTISGPTKFGPTVASLTSLSGPNNSATNFFQSQINVSNSLAGNVGQLDTTGTLGTTNVAPNAAPVTGQRWHWDQTNVDITSSLTTSQKAGVFQFGPVNNGYLVHLLSLQIDVLSPVITPVKTVDKTMATVGDTLTYTAVFANTGNLTTSNLFFIDTIPTGTTFIPDSLSLNGSLVPGASPLPPSGYSVGATGINQTTTITFKVNVTSGVGTTLNNSYGISYNYTPTSTVLYQNVQSNIVSTFVYGLASVANTKSVNKKYAAIGDILTYTMTLPNTGSTTALNTVFIDTIPNDTSFITNSLTLNGVVQSGQSPAPPTGFTIPTIAVGQTVTLTFKVQVNTMPNPNPIPNSSYIGYNYTITLPSDNSSGTPSNTVFTQVNKADIVGIRKSVDKSYATCGDTITYTIVLPNSGNVTAINVFFKDTVPNGATFITNSLAVDGVTQNGANPLVGVTIPAIGAGVTTTITFKALISC